MPGRNRTGPQGAGPRTGRGLGYCAGGMALMGLGLRRGFGRGRGWRNWTQWAEEDAPVPQDEATALKSQAEQLQAQLDAVQQRLTELEQS